MRLFLFAITALLLLAGASGLLCGRMRPEDNQADPYTQERLSETIAALRSVPDNGTTETLALYAWADYLEQVGRQNEQCVKTPDGAFEAFRRWNGRKDR